MSNTPLPYPDPWRTGYCDGLQGKECISPWANKGFKMIRRNSLYLTGYLEGQKRRHENARK